VSLHNRHSATLWDLNQTAELARAGKALDHRWPRSMTAFHLLRAGAHQGKALPLASISSTSRGFHS
jgi:hypothetical protein